MEYYTTHIWGCKVAWLASYHKVILFTKKLHRDYFNMIYYYELDKYCQCTMVYIVALINGIKWGGPHRVAVLHQL